MKYIRFLLLFFIGLLAGILLLASLLYVFKVPVLKAAAEHSLPSRVFRLDELYDLKLGWSEASLQQLVFETGENAAVQEINGIRLRYALPQQALLSLEIDRISSVLPVWQDAAQPQQASAPLLIAGLIAQLESLPLPRIEIRQLELAGYPPLSLSASRDQSRLYLTLSDESTSLSLALDSRGDALELQLAVERFAQQLLLANLQLGKVGAAPDAIAGQAEAGKRPLQMKLEIDAGRLLDALDYYAAWFPALSMPLESGIEKPEGKLVGDIHLLLPEALPADWLPARVFVHLDASSQLALTWRDPVWAPEGSEISLQVESDVYTHLANIESQWLPFFEGGKLAFSAREFFYQGKIDAELSDVVCDWQNAGYCVADWRMKGEALSFRYQDLLMQEPVFNLAGQGFFHRDEIRLAVSPGQIFSMRSLERAGDTLLQPAFILKEKGAVVLDPGKGIYRGGFPLARLQMPSVNYDEYHIATVLELGNIDFRFVDELQAGCRLASKSLNVSLPGQWLPSLAFDMQLSMTGDEVTAEGGLTTGKSTPLLQLNLDHHLSRGEGTAQLVWTRLAFTETQPLSAVFKPWPYPLDLVAGEFNGYANLGWSEENGVTSVSGKIRHGFHGVNGFYEDAVFVGLNGDMKLSLSEHGDLSTDVPASLIVSTLDVGVPLENLSLDYAFNTAESLYRLNHFKAWMLGGVISTEDVTYREGSEANRLLLKLDGVQLASVLSLAGYESVAGSGELYGRFPFRIEHGRLLMDEGVLSATEQGGVIRYASAAGKAAVAANPALKLVTDALSNYHFETLRADASYNEQGDLNLKMSMAGQNPDMNQGQKIKLNLNLSDNIPSLLKSLQAGRMITDVLERQVTKH